VVNGVRAALSELERLGLPRVVIEGLKLKGIASLTPPQREAVDKGLLNGRNIVVSAPTASGKTLIAELALVAAALRGRIGVYATPLKALASEKFAEFKLWEKFGLKIGISTGDFEEPGEALGKYDIIVATYERLDSLFRHRPRWLERLGTVVIDELHTINDGERGPIVELIATRALTLGRQIVGLSATVGNPSKLAKWLDAELVVSNWRPVKLIEGFYNKRKNIIEFVDGRAEEVRTGDVIAHVVTKALKEDYQVLIFLQARRRAEHTASRVAELVNKALDSYDKNRLRELVSELRESSSSAIEREKLGQLIEKGVAFHHAGLSYGARRVIEKGFRARLLKVVCATPTLAAGINMPARRVLVYTRRFEHGYLRPISIAEYKQMAGRAGRPQFDPYGEAIIVDAPPAEARKYITSQPEPVLSKLWNERALRIHVLATVVSGYARTIEEVVSFFSKTFGAQDYRFILSRGKIVKVIDELSEMGMLTRNGYLVPTALGEAVSRLYIDPLSADRIVKVLKEFDEVDDIFYLHLIAYTPDFNRVRITRYAELEDEAIYLANEELIPRPPLSDVEFEEWLRAYKIARILEAWINEVDEDSIVNSFGIGPGDLAAIVDTASWLLNAAATICRVASLEKHFRKLHILARRVENGVKEDLLELVKVKGIGRVRARVLANRGIKTIEMLAAASPTKIAVLPGFGERVARKVIEEARKLLKSLHS